MIHLASWCSLGALLLNLRNHDVYQLCSSSRGNEAGNQNAQNAEPVLIHYHIVSEESDGWWIAIPYAFSYKKSTSPVICVAFYDGLYKMAVPVVCDNLSHFSLQACLVRCIRSSTIEAHCHRATKNALGRLSASEGAPQDMTP